jgi:hypothetical protein
MQIHTMSAEQQSVLAARTERMCVCAHEHTNRYRLRAVFFFVASCAQDGLSVCGAHKPHVAWMMTVRDLFHE